MWIVHSICCAVNSALEAGRVQIAMKLQSLLSLAAAVLLNSPYVQATPIICPDVSQFASSATVLVLQDLLTTKTLADVPQHHREPGISSSPAKLVPRAAAHTALAKATSTCPAVDQRPPLLENSGICEVASSSTRGRGQRLRW